MIKIIKGKYKRIPKKFSKHLSDMVHWLLTKNSKKRPSIEEIILHPLFQKKAVQLRIPLPIRPKEVILPGDDLKLTGGCFDTDDFAMKQNLTSDVKAENTKKKIRGSDVTKRVSFPTVKVKTQAPLKTKEDTVEIHKINKCFRYDYSYQIIIWKIIILQL
jgi:serine/threonine protein kinase